MYLSAVLVDLASWRWILVPPVVLVAIAVAVAVVMVLRSVPNSREESQHAFDTVGSCRPWSRWSGSSSFSTTVPDEAGPRRDAAEPPRRRRHHGRIEPRAAARIGSRSTMAAEIFPGGAGLVLMAVLRS